MVMVILVAVIMLVVAGAAAAMVISNTLALSKEEQGAIAYSIAESAVEEGILRSLRDPSLEVSGESLAAESGEAILNISGSDPKVITAAGRAGNQEKTLEVRLRFEAGQMIIESWEEI